MDEESDFMEIDEETVNEVKWGIVKYSVVFVLFVFVPLMITILTSNSLSKLNIFAGFIAVTIICTEQVVNLSRFLASVQYEDEEEEENN